MAQQTQTRHVDDIRPAIAATLTRPGGTVVDLTTLTGKFKMVDTEGNSKVALTTVGVNVTDAEAGEIQYSPVAADVDTEGSFYAYFVMEDANGKKDTFPVRKGELKIAIMADA